MFQSRRDDRIIAISDMFQSPRDDMIIDAGCISNPERMAGL
jgi:hypothetical protein